MITEADDVMASDRPKLLEFGIAEETAWRAGLPCGGAIKIYVEPLRRERDGVYLEAVLAARLTRTSLAVLTTLRTGARRLFDARVTCPKSSSQSRATSMAPRDFRRSLTSRTSIARSSRQPLVGIDFHDLHHTELLVVHHVAVEHVFAGEVEEARAEGDAAIAWDDHRVHP